MANDHMKNCCVPTVKRVLQIGWRKNKMKICAPALESVLGVTRMPLVRTFPLQLSHDGTDDDLDNL